MKQQYQTEYNHNGDTLVISFTAEFEQEDVGIGSYEYWGARCNDVQMEFVCQSVGIDSVKKSDGLDFTDAIKGKLLDKIVSHCESYADANAPVIEGVDYDDGEYDEDQPDVYENENYIED